MLTAVLAPDALQANPVVHPAALASLFAEFCAANPRPRPLLAMTSPSDPTHIEPGEIPVSWACGVMPQSVIRGSDVEFAITYQTGCMLVCDLPADVHPGDLGRLRGWQ